MEDIINWSDNSSGVTEPITITLDGDGDTSVDFEQAFGDYSEARGRRRERRRARRQERKLKRIARRQERQKARVQARLERKQMKADARAMRKGGDEEGDDSSEPTDSGSTASEPSGETSSAPSDSSSDTPTPPPSEPSEGSNEENDTAEEEQAVNDETGESDEASGFTGDYGFDGQRQPSKYDVQWDSYYQSAEGTEKIHPRVKELSRRIEKNKELAKHIEARLLKITTRVESSGKPMGRVDANIVRELNAQLTRVKNRIADLESKLAGYSKFFGEYSNAEGGQWKENARRRAEVRQAKRLARKERQQFIKDKRKARVQELMGGFVAQGMTRKEARLKARQQAYAENPFNATKVDSSLNPTISSNKIDIPPSDSASSFSGTGLIGLDAYNDYDAPPTRYLELDFSNASGNMKGNWKWIAIGVVVAVGGIFAYNKFIKKK